MAVVVYVASDCPMLLFDVHLGSHPTLVRNLLTQTVLASQAAHRGVDPGEQQVAAQGHQRWLAINSHRCCCIEFLHYANKPRVRIGQCSKILEYLL